MAAKDRFVVLVTCGTASEADRIARELVSKRLAACVNVLESPVRSIYRWQGKVENATEHLLLIKTTRARLRGLQKRVEELHSYDVPEMIALPIVEGSEKYLAWLDESVKRGSKGGKGGRGSRGGKGKPQLFRS